MFFNNSIKNIDLLNEDIDYTSIILLYYILNLTWVHSKQKYIFDPVITNSNKYTKLLLCLSNNEDYKLCEQDLKEIGCDNNNNRRFCDGIKKNITDINTYINNIKKDVFKIEVVIFFAYINTLYSNKPGGEYFKLTYENKKLTNSNMTFNNKTQVEFNLPTLINSFFFNFKSQIGGKVKKTKKNIRRKVYKIYSIKNKKTIKMNKNKKTIKMNKNNKITKRNKRNKRNKITKRNKI
jgi:hypothetical protein